MIIDRLKELLTYGAKPATTCLSVHQGESTGGKYLCFFASFDHSSRIADYVLAYLAELKRQGCDVVFVSTSPKLTDEGLSSLKPLCHKIILRKNIGLDFASWVVASQKTKSIDKYSGILLANDSVLGPLNDLDAVFEKISLATEHVIGLNDSHELGHHLQSFFIYIPIKVFNSSAIRRFWRGIRVLKNKQAIIDRYEIGFSAYLRKNSIPYRAVFPVDSLIEKAALSKEPSFEFQDRLDNHLPINPSLHFWRELIKEFDYPFVKRELMTRNPIGSTYVEGFKSDLPRNHGQVGKMIVEYLSNDPV